MSFGCCGSRDAIMSRTAKLALNRVRLWLIKATGVERTHPSGGC